MADARGLASDEMLMSTASWYELRDAIYVAEAAAADAEVDLIDAGDRDELVAIVRDLRHAIAGVVDAVGEPRAVGGSD